MHCFLIKVQSWQCSTHPCIIDVRVRRTDNNLIDVVSSCVGSNNASFIVLYDGDGHIPCCTLCDNGKTKYIIPNQHSVVGEIMRCYSMIRVFFSKLQSIFLNCHNSHHSNQFIMVILNNCLLNTLQSDKIMVPMVLNLKEKYILFRNT